MQGGEATDIKVWGHLKHEGKMVKWSQNLKRLRKRGSSEEHCIPHLLFRASPPCCSCQQKRLLTAIYEVPTMSQIPHADNIRISDTAGLTVWEKEAYKQAL
uniref:uncharacterized protein LOC118147883 n=1 Tax=Callithrix jacchus TaxID=9483 RepID=UPI0023DD074F|nr:uncharacterized protein LOC118147883 [Callithrix jacchus]